MRSLEGPLGPKVWEGVVKPPGCLSPDSSNPLEWKHPSAWGGRKGGGEGCWSINGVKGIETRPLPCQGRGGEWGLAIRRTLAF